MAGTIPTGPLIYVTPTTRIRVCGTFLSSMRETLIRRHFICGALLALPVAKPSCRCRVGERCCSVHRTRTGGSLVQRPTPGVRMVMILVVDDLPDTCRVLVRLLRISG